MPARQRSTSPLHAQFAGQRTLVNTRKNVFAPRASAQTSDQRNNGSCGGSPGLLPMLTRMRFVRNFATCAIPSG